MNTSVKIVGTLGDRSRPSIRSVTPRSISAADASERMARPKIAPTATGMPMLRSAATEVQPVPGRDLNSPGCDAFGGAGARGSGRDIAGLPPEGSSQLGAGTVVGAHEQHPAHGMPDTGSEAIQGARGEAEVAAALVCFGAVPPYQACNLEGAQVVGEQVGGDVKLGLQFAGRVVTQGEQIHDPQPGSVGQGRVLRKPNVKGYSLSFHCFNFD